MPLSIVDVDLETGAWEGLPSSDWKAARSMIESFNEQGESQVGGRVAWFAFKKAVGALHTVLGDHWGDEVEQLAEGIGVSPGDVVTANLAYELGQVGCSTFGHATASGPIHARNLDWTFPRGLLKKKLTCVRFRGAAAGDHTAVTWPGLFGVLTGVAPGRFSVSVNFVYHSSETGVRSLATAAMAGNWPVAWAVRKALDEAGDFDEAVSFLKTAPLLAPVLFTVCGVDNDQRVIIERSTRDHALRRPSGDDAVCVTNHYLSKKFRAATVHPAGWLTQERLDALTARLAARPPRAAVSAMNALASDGVLRPDTQHQVAMSARSGTLSVRIPGEATTRVKVVGLA